MFYVQWGFLLQSIRRFKIFIPKRRFYFPISELIPAISITGGSLACKRILLILRPVYMHCGLGQNVK